MTENKITTAGNEDLIVVKGLCKDFGDNKVLKDISTTIKKGEKCTFT